MMPVDNFDNMGIMLRKAPGRGEDKEKQGRESRESKKRRWRTGMTEGKRWRWAGKEQGRKDRKEECNNQQTPQVAAILTDRAKTELN